MGRTTPLCPQCQEVGPETVVEHSTLGLIQYETCRDCTYHNLSRASLQGAIGHGLAMRRRMS